MSRSASNTSAASPSSAQSTDPSQPRTTAVAAPAAPAALPARPTDFYPNARARYVTQWVLPGAAVSGLAGGVVGATLAAVLHPRRPMFATSLTVASKFGFCSLLYLGAVSSWTKHTPPAWNEQRAAVHLGVGAFTGAILGSVTGRSWGAMGNRSRGMGRGALLGAALALPAWWVMEGRHPRGMFDEMEASSVAATAAGSQETTREDRAAAPSSPAVKS